MVISVSYELKTFGASVLMALVFGILYDITGAFSKVTGKKAAWDFFGWFAACTLLGSLWFYLQNGEIRWYMVLGALVSGILYFFTLEKYVFWVFTFIASIICRFFHIILKIVLTPFKFLGKMLGVYINKANTKFFRKEKDENYEKNA